MKPFLGIDLTHNKKNEEFNGDKFLIAKPSAALAESLERHSENADEVIEKSKLPKPLRIIQLISAGLAAVVFLGVTRALVDEDALPLVEAYNNAPWLFWLGGVSFIFWGVLKLASMKQEKAVLTADDSTRAISNLESVCNAIFTELSVPADAKEVDILSFFYKDRGDTIKVCEKFLPGAHYMNPVFKVFADSENLYVADTDGKYAFPLSSIKGITTVKKSIGIVMWNKDEPYNKGSYKQYKLKEDKNGCILCKLYHVIELERDGEEWGIYIPCYELPVFEELLGLKAKSE